MMSNVNPKVGLYARVSTANMGQNPQMQIDDLRRLAAQRGWAVYSEYVDHGVSGGKDRRPELDRMMVDAHNGKLNVVAVWRFDRFARSVKHLVTALEDFRARSIDFVSMHDGIDTSTPGGRFTFHVIAAVAELQRELIRENVRLSLQTAKRNGQRLGRPPVVVPIDEVLLMRSKGRSYREIARTLGIGASTVHRAVNDYWAACPTNQPARIVSPTPKHGEITTPKLDS